MEAQRAMYRSYRDAVCRGLKPVVHETPVVKQDWVETITEKHTETQASTEPASTELTVEDEVKEQWEKEQLEMVQKVIIKDVDGWAKHRVTSENSSKYPGVRPLQYIGGLDISFIKGDNVNACAAFVVLNYPELEVVYEDLSMVKLTAPYIPGYLAFREAEFLVEKIRRVQSIKPELIPQVVMSDGNGILHPRKYGIACHLGVLTGIPQVGAAKNLFAVRGIQKNAEFDTHIRRMQQGGDAFPLRDEHDEILGAALKAHEGCKNPIYVSPGHKVSVATAVWITKICCKHRVPEPTRQADIRSREYLRFHFPTERQLQLKKQPKRNKNHKMNSHKINNESNDASDSEQNPGPSLVNRGKDTHSTEQRSEKQQWQSKES